MINGFGCISLSKSGSKYSQGTDLTINMLSMPVMDHLRIRKFNVRVTGKEVEPCHAHVLMSFITVYEVFGVLVFDQRMFAGRPTILCKTD